MKNLLLKPGFESIFALSIIAIIGLPPLVMGQNKKEVVKQLEIKIKDGDTIVNGKNIKDLPPNERDELLSDVIVDARAFTIHPRPDGKKHKIVIKRKGQKGDKDILIERAGPGDAEFNVFENEEDILINDSLGKKLGLRLKKLRDMPEMAFDMKLNGDPMHGRDGIFFDGGPRVREFGRGLAIDNFTRPNSQSFNYTTTDDEGISTRVSYRVNDASPEKLKQIAGLDKADLTLKDINLSPEFSTGKTLLSFNLPAKTAAEVQFKDSQGKLLWSDKAANGSFTKSFSLGLNGAYYLQVKQGSNVAVKRVVKED